MKFRRGRVSLLSQKIRDRVDIHGGAATMYTFVDYEVDVSR